MIVNEIDKQVIESLSNLVKDMIVTLEDSGLTDGENRGFRQEHDKIMEMSGKLREKAEREQTRFIANTIDPDNNPYELLEKALHGFVDDLRISVSADGNLHRSKPHDTIRNIVKRHRKEMGVQDGRRYGGLVAQIKNLEAQQGVKARVFGQDWINTEQSTLEKFLYMCESILNPSIELTGDAKHHLQLAYRDFVTIKNLEKYYPNQYANDLNKLVMVAHEWVFPQLKDERLKADFKKSLDAFMKEGHGLFQSPWKQNLIESPCKLCGEDHPSDYECHVVKEMADLSKTHDSVRSSPDKGIEVKCNKCSEWINKDHPCVAHKKDSDGFLTAEWLQNAFNSLSGDPNIKVTPIPRDMIPPEVQNKIDSILKEHNEEPLFTVESAGASEEEIKDAVDTVLKYRGRDGEDLNLSDETLDKLESYIENGEKGEGEIYVPPDLTRKSNPEIDLYERLEKDIIAMVERIQSNLGGIGINWGDVNPEIRAIINRHRDNSKDHYKSPEPTIQLQDAPEGGNPWNTILERIQKGEDFWFGDVKYVGFAPKSEAFDKGHKFTDEFDLNIYGNHREGISFATDIPMSAIDIEANLYSYDGVKKSEYPLSFYVRESETHSNHLVFFFPNIPARTDGCIKITYDLPK